MRIAIVAPSSVPFVIGGAEKLWWGLQSALNTSGEHACELIKLPSPERDFWEIINSYRRFAELDLQHFDRVITTKYPAWMVSHPEHVVYLQHTLRGLYDTYPDHLPQRLGTAPDVLRPLLDLLRRPGLDRDALPEIFERIDGLRTAGLPPELLALPGPLLREIVHALDGIALAPTAVRRHLAISWTVARRPGYFPPGVEVDAIPHPSDLPSYRCETPRAIFTLSRLVAPKRVDLLLRAYRKADIDLPFEIAGTGPEVAHLQSLAAGDPRIRFLGGLSDQAVIDHYAHAAFVPFIPADEDMGLITFEAMASGKPVLTTTDAGGPTEHVEPGRTGEVVAPRVDDLAAAMRRLADDPERTRQMGQAARDYAHTIDWATIANALTADLPPARQPERRSRWLVVNTFSAWPPDSGGRQRIYHLYRGLSAYADIHYLCLVPPGQGGQARIVPGFHETRIEASEALTRRIGSLEEQLGISAWDLAAMRWGASEPALKDALAHAAGQADLAICSHPYLYPALSETWGGPLIYDCHNVEQDLKAGMVRDPQRAAPVLHELDQVEGALTRRADQLWVCSGENGERLAGLYDAPHAPQHIVPNGVDIDAIPCHDPTERVERKQRLGLDGHPLAVFIGSLHQPNIEAAAHIHRLAEQCPDWLFVILGTVGRADALAHPPANVIQPGLVDDAVKHAWFGAADLALNPMTGGSGTNLKMPEYAAAGLPILTTPHGSRGLPLEGGQHCIEAPIHAFADHLARVCHEPDRMARMARHARQLIRDTLDWHVIARQAAAAARDGHGSQDP